MPRSTDDVGVCVRLWFAKDAKPIARCRDEAKEEVEEEVEQDEERELIFLIL